MNSPNEMKGKERVFKIYVNVYTHSLTTFGRQACRQAKKENLVHIMRKIFNSDLIF